MWACLARNTLISRCRYDSPTQPKRLATFCVNDILDGDCNAVQRSPLLHWRLIQKPGLLHHIFGV